MIIEPGVQVLMNGYFQLNFNGQVIAKGTDANPISFRSYDTTGFHDRDIPNGGWKGIRTVSTGTVKFDTFENCHFQNLKMIAYEDMLMFFGPVFINKCRFYKNTSPDFYMSAAAMIHVFNSIDSINYPIIRNSRFYNNDVRNKLIHVGCDNFEFTNNEVNNNNWGYGLGIYGNNANGSSVIVKKNKFFNNSSRFFTMGGNGGPLNVYRINDFYFQDNKVYGNSIPGTAGILMWNCKGIVERNLFANNLSNSYSNCMGTSGGIIMLSGGEDSLKAKVVTTIFRNNIIANNMTTSYGVLSLHYTNIEVANNTFVNNSTSFFGPSIYTWGQDRNYKIINNIFQNNRSGGEMLFGNNEMFLANHNHFEINNNLMDKPLANSLVDYYELGVDFSLGDTSLNIVNTSSVLVSPTADTGYMLDALYADFSLIAGTAAIDAGLHSGISLAPTDYLKHVRVINGIVDVGAIEYGSSK